MSTNRISLVSVLTPDERIALDEFCAAHDAADLEGVSEFLRTAFDVNLSLDPHIIVGFVEDSSNLPGAAAGLCRPSSVRECAVVFRTCWNLKIPFTITGGRSNLTGSATPEGGIVVSTCNMLATPVSVDAARLRVRCSVGMILEDMRVAVLKQSLRRLMFPVDPTSRSDASVGGALACNASGFTPGPKGAMREWVEQIEFLLPDGRAVQAERGQYVSESGLFLLAEDGQTMELPVPRYPRPAIKNASGPFSAGDGAMDFVDYAIGSEGIFGLITGCELKLVEAPGDWLDLFFSLPSENDALKLHAYLLAKPGGFEQMTAFEYFGVNCRKYLNHEDRLFAADHAVGINIQVPLYCTTIDDAAEQWLTMLSDADCGVDEDSILLLDNDRDRGILIDARHSMPANTVEVVQRRGTFTIMTDTVVPPEQFGAFLAFANKLIVSHGLEYLSFGHFGDCHLHFMILPEREQLDEARRVYDRIVEKSAELGGVYSGEHGTGKRKRADFLKCYGQAAVDELASCKRAIDPYLLLNRGNVFEAG